MEQTTPTLTRERQPRVELEEIEHLRERVESELGRLRSLRLVVVAGGFSEEYEVSLESGSSVYHALLQRDYQVDLFKLDQLNRDRLPRITDYDLVINMLHGTHGEDGSFEGLCRVLDVPSLGTGVQSASLCFNKALTKRMFLEGGAATPEYVLVNEGELSNKRDELMELEPPLVIKPVTSGSSLGVEKVESQSYLNRALPEALSEYRQVIVERQIEGTELTAGVMGVREPFALPLVQISPEEGWYNYENKYEPGNTELICPPDIPGDTAEKIREQARSLYRTLGIEVLARFDLILDEEGTPYFLEVNTIPGFTSTSLFPRAAETAGLPYIDLLEALIYLSYFEKQSG